ncbi:hypothetical protein [Stutzerimonas frequens]|nr:hypothetical protein [Stutzerimonas frequens]MBA4727132.1 hypothetical protein [Pseudomonas sp.]WCR44435.1 hypothetical protein OML25_00155 [Stutzerimonas stutzeri]MBK3871966.1 hypothetical protein [Stutzerimonas frequens]MBK3910301.1 hypothetical protein [Stutzerimonas frequens]MBK3928130.1 hypothetical protein [Stutzerimonas frequens]
MAVISTSSAGCSVAGMNLDGSPATAQTMQTIRSLPMDDYQDELLEWHAAEQDHPDSAEDAVEL